MTKLYAHLEETCVIDGKRVKFERNPEEEYHNQEIARMTSYVHCWFSGGEPTPAMWDKYEAKSASVCIQTNARSLIEAIPRQSPFGEVLLGKVTYSNSTEPIGTFYSYLPWFHKQQKYALEQEVRLLAFVSPDPKTGQYLVEAKRMLLTAQIPRIIHRVILGPSISAEDEQVICGDVAGFAGNVPVSRKT